MIGRVAGPPVLVLVTGPPGTGKSTLAAGAAEELGACVLSWDWAMAALTPFEDIQSVLDAMDPTRHRAVGWALLFHLARAQLRAGRPAVLDGVARSGEVRDARRLAEETESHIVVIVTECSDEEQHRQRVEGRVRSIPGWYELEWDRVQRALPDWEPPEAAELTVDAIAALEENLEAVRSLLRRPELS